MEKLNSTDLPILIAGPTASGKSSLANSLAERFDGAIVNADALQVYAGWKILSARPQEAEVQTYPHHLYGHVPMDVSYSVGAWLRDLKPVLKDVQRQKKRPIIVGGTGLYFTALTTGLVEIPPVPVSVRVQADEMIACHGLGVFAEILLQRDPETFHHIDVQNPARARRAWEVLITTGKGLRDWQINTPKPMLALENTVPMVINSDRDWLAHRIEQRFDLMIKQGALEEVETVLKNAWHPDLPSARAIGARELVDHIQGHIGLENAIQDAKAQTRQYAKRQRTWFRSKMKTWQQIFVDDQGFSPALAF